MPALLRVLGSCPRAAVWTDFPPTFWSTGSGGGDRISGSEGESPREKVVRLVAIFLKASNVARLVGIVKAAGVFLVTGGLPRSLRCDTGDRGCCES